MTIRSISPQELNNLRQAGQPVDLVDVRTPEEFAAVHAEGAQLVPLDTLSVQAVQAGRQGRADAPVYVICQAGGRSMQACQRLAAAGLTNVVNVSGGTAAWQKAGLPVVRPGGGGGKRSWLRPLGLLAVVGGLVLGWTVHPYFAVGAMVAWVGLAVAGGGCPLSSCGVRS